VSVIFEKRKREREREREREKEKLIESSPRENNISGASEVIGWKQFRFSYVINLTRF
jgi:hypothetical protein